MLTVDFGRLGLRPGMRVLDIGCGNGRHAFEALRRGADVAATDLDDEALAEVTDMAGAMRTGRARCRSGATCARCAPTRATSPSPTPSSTSSSPPRCSSTSTTTRAAIGELRRVLRPGGLLAVTVPRWWPERVCWALSREYHEVPGGHVRIYRRRQLAERLRRSGLVLAPPHHHAHALHSPYWWLRCALGMSRDQAPAARLYHRFLVYDLMRRPRWTRSLERSSTPCWARASCSTPAARRCRRGTRGVIEHVR